VVFITLLLASAIVPTQARAQTFKVLHTFHGKDGARPVGQLAQDKAGNFYGTTGTGGLGRCQLGCGTAFKMNKSGTIAWTHSFSGPNGQNPGGGLLRGSAGSLYGTTAFGGKCDRALEWKTVSAVTWWICPSGTFFGSGGHWKLKALALVKPGLLQIFG
jgi:hypothetical protein